VGIKQLLFDPVQEHIDSEARTGRSGNSGEKYRTTGSVVATRAPILPWLTRTQYLGIWLVIMHQPAHVVYHFWTTKKLVYHFWTTKTVFHFWKTTNCTIVVHVYIKKPV
jgi:hypothetical protein